MYKKYPFALLLAPKKDGLYVVKHQGKVRYIGIAFKGESGKNIKEELKYHYKNQKTEIAFMYDNPELTSVLHLPMGSYEAALEERQRLILKHQKTVGKYHK